MANARLLPDENPLAEAQFLIAGGRAQEAVARLQALLARGRGGLLLRATLVKALSESGDLQGAIALARETALMNPDAAIAAISLGETMLAAGNLAIAIGEFQRALRLDPQSARARMQLGIAWLEAGEAEKALEAFAAIGEGNAPAELSGKIAEARVMQMRPRSDPRYVRHLFDEFSASYDARMLEQLSYGAPAILRQLAGMLGLEAARKYAVLDLGCGTGLSGLAFADVAARLDGIDLSPAMIAKARARRIYNSLEVGDIEGVLRRADPTYDLVVAADTLVYLGDLARLFDGVVQHLAPGGLFVFTVEKSEGADFELGSKRRWRHSEPYVRSEAARVHLDVAGILACHPRTEAGVPVEGLAIALRCCLAEKVG